MDSIGLLSAGKAVVAYRGGTLSKMKASMQAGIAKGRAGFPKPLGPLPRIGLSAQARKLNEQFLNSATTMFNTLYNSSVDQETFNYTVIMAKRAQAGNNIIDRWKDPGSARGSRFNSIA